MPFVFIVLECTKLHDIKRLKVWFLIGIAGIISTVCKYANAAICGGFNYLKT